ncbi:hypothetical protein BG004_003485 [Podila humilis]|nr:hypothetical protein BG004_003485 [Podila humilis]
MLVGHASEPDEWEIQYAQPMLATKAIGYENDTEISSPAGASQPGAKSSSVYNPVNNFNSQDVTNFFNKSWTAALENHHQTRVSGSGKSELYKSTETMAWGSKAPKKGVTSSGADFLAEIKRKETPAA